MTGELDSRRPQGEQIPDGWKPISPLDEEFKDFDQIRARISREAEIDWVNSKKYETTVIDGFEDIFHKPLGSGFGGFNNTNFAVYQLIFALSRSSHPAIAKLLSDGGSITSGDAIKMLRHKSVLKGLRVMDLGCSSLPAFALAARSLGANVYTVDAQDIQAKYKDYLSGHTVLDLRDENAAEILRNNTGGGLDLMTEAIIGAGWDAPHNLKSPEAKTIIKIADVLLKQGGYLYSNLFTTSRVSAIKKTE